MTSLGESPPASSGKHSEAWAEPLHRLGVPLRAYEATAASALPPRSSRVLVEVRVVLNLFRRGVVGWSIDSQP